METTSGAYGDTVITPPICDDCGQDMRYADGCPMETLAMEHDEAVERLTHESPLRCPDCKAMPGMFHHRGCWVETCPQCGGQFVTCRCVAEGG